MRMAIGIAALALAFSSCNRKFDGSTPRMDAAKARLEQVRRACASQLTYARLKEYVFDEAARIRNSDPGVLDPLAAHSVVRMEDPVVKSRDDELNITVCTGRFVLNLPPGIQDAFNGQPVIGADVEYAAQAAADGSGLVYSMNGAEPIIYRIATLGLSTRPMPHIAAAPMEAGGETTTADIELAETRPQRPVAKPPPVHNAERMAIAAPEKRVAARPEREPARRAQENASPSFNCRHAKTPSEKMVCNSDTLAAADRRMSAVYYSEMARADAEAKRTLRRTRDKFLAKRERCSTQACAARVYAQRLVEIRRITGD
jgi:uncharacterized protein YecT (DUF1311 family)